MRCCIVVVVALALASAAPLMPPAANLTSLGNETAAVEEGGVVLETIFRFLTIDIPGLFAESLQQQVLITYIRITPAVKCDIGRVLSLYDQRLGETNPDARSIQSRPVQLGGRSCGNATARCHCGPHGRRALGAKTLKVETRALARANLNPVERFPFEVQTVAMA